MFDNFRRSNATAALIAGCLVVIAFRSVVTLGYVWDDTAFTSQVGTLTGRSFVAALFREVLPDTGYFRPVGLFALLADLRWLGNPAASHAINLALHVLNTAL